MEIIVAENAGTCFGVERAIKKAFDSVENSSGNVYIMGEVVHNPYVVKKLSDAGVKQVRSLDEIRIGGKTTTNLIIRAHGEPKSVYDFCNENNIKIVDCTCPFVKNAQEKAIELEEEGHQVVIIGEPEHPEVKGIVARTKNGFVLSSPDEVEEKKVKFGKLGILAQTTQSLENFRQTVAKIVRYPKVIKVYNTICTATEERQRAAKRLAENVDLMIVIGGRNSSNTKRLFEICQGLAETKWIENTQEFDDKWLDGVNSVGITAGASTPKEMIDELFKKLKNI